jgi:hypothetical protein
MLNPEITMIVGVEVSGIKLMVTMEVSVSEVLYFRTIPISTFTVIGEGLPPAQTVIRFATAASVPLVAAVCQQTQIALYQAVMLGLQISGA